MITRVRSSIYYSTQLGLFFKIGYVYKSPKRGVGRTLLTQFAVKILCDDSTSCDGMDDYFATEANTMMAIVYEDDLDDDDF